MSVSGILGHKPLSWKTIYPELASESCALTSVGAEFIRDIEPGEMITISRNGIESNKIEYR
ncbi:MAG: hypothetical protein ACLUD0_17120 [Eubacterium ramulus]